MGSNSPFLDLLRISSELMEKSARLNQRARECISSTNGVVESSRNLLSSWPVSGTLRVPRLFVLGTERSPPGRPVSLPAAPASSADGQAAGFIRVRGLDFAKETVRLDGQHFIDCTMQNCVLEYCGGPVILEGTEFSGCRFSFGGQAAMTVAMLECFGLIGEQTVKAVASPPAPARRTRVN